jgi:hypothetical protein
VLRFIDVDTGFKVNRSSHRPQLYSVLDATGLAIINLLDEEAEGLSLLLSATGVYLGGIGAGFRSNIK